MAEDNSQADMDAQEQEDANGVHGLENIFATLPRPKSLLSLAQSVITIILRFLRIREIIDPRMVDANRIYSTREAAKFLGTDRIGVIQLIRAGKIHGKKLNDNYNIVGRSIILFLRTDDDDTPPRAKKKIRQGT